MSTSIPTLAAALKAALVVAPVLGLAAGLGAYFGVRAAHPGAPGEASAARAVVEPGATDAVDTATAAEFTNATRALTQEVRRLSDTLERFETARRTAVPAGEQTHVDGGTSAVVDGPAILAALDRAVAAIQRAGERVAGPGTAGVHMPAEPMNVERLRHLITTPYEDAQVEHAYWSVQRVLDTYGRPSSVSTGNMMYEVRTGDDFSVTFKLGGTGFVEAVFY